MNTTMLNDLITIMKKDDYNARFYEIFNMIDDVTIDVAEEYCKVHADQNDGIEFLNSLSDVELGVLLSEVIKAMLERAAM